VELLSGAFTKLLEEAVPDGLHLHNIVVCHLDLVLDVFTLGDMRKFEYLLPFFALSLALATSTCHNNSNQFNNLVTSFTFIYVIGHMHKHKT
jgi:hypothetical protein